MVASCALDARASRRPAHSSGIEAPELPTLDRVGSALALEDVVVHLQLFPSNGQSRQAHGFTRMAGPSQRGPRY